MIPDSFFAIANHVWQSTLFACAAGLLTLALRENRARVRHWIWVAASLKFLAPFSLLIRLGSSIPWHDASRPAPAYFSGTLDQVSAPFVAPAVSLPSSPTGVSTGSVLPMILWIVWACGFLFVVCSSWIRWRRVVAIVRSGSTVDIGLPITAISSPSFLEPGVFGVFRPVLLLPEGILEQLTREQWKAVVAHELCHVRHRDNLIGTVQMLVEAVFWFHPLAWWMGKRICHERERACDEEVLRMGSEPRIYAQGILKVCELYLESPVACVAGISGSNLRKRIEAILHHCAVRDLNWSRKALIGCAAVAALVTPLVIGMFGATSVRAQGSDWETVAGGKMRFEVASIKPSTAFRPPNFPLDPGDAKTAGGRMSVVFPLISFVGFAYKLMPDEISKPLPKSFPTNASFDLEARAAGNPTKDQMRLMMQSLLAERFKLKVHFETREGPVLALTLVRPGHTGAKLHPHAEGPACPEAFEMASPGSFPNPKDVFPPVCGWAQMRGTKNSALIGGRDLPMETIAGNVHGYGSLAGEIDKPVIDQTGLKGRYDFTLQLPPGALHLMTVVAPRTDGALPDVPETPFTNALRDQLGLKLVSTRGPIRKLVIDHVEQLSGN